jgi:hypothetical protein
MKLGGAMTELDVADHLNASAEGADAVVVLVEDQFLPLFEPFRDAFFLVPFASSYEGKSAQNYLSRVLSRLLRNFCIYWQRFTDAKYLKVLLLPLQSFSAAEMGELRALMHDTNMEPEFAPTLDQILGRLRRRQTPRKDTRFSRVYLRDDHSLFFEYGHEHHARVETKRPPHHASCLPNSNFRFGMRYDAERHFNVSAEKNNARLSANFDGCHNQGIAVRDATHVNMFPNGFLHEKTGTA